MRYASFLTIALCACGAAGVDGTWTGSTEGGGVELTVSDGEVSGEITVDPDNVVACDGAGTDHLTFDVDGALSGRSFHADLSYPGHATDASLDVAFGGDGTGSGTAEGTVDLVGIDPVSGAAGTCHAGFSDPFDLARDGAGTGDSG